MWQQPTPEADVFIERVNALPNEPGVSLDHASKPSLVEEEELRRLFATDPRTPPTLTLGSSIFSTDRPLLERQGPELSGILKTSAQNIYFPFLRRRGGRKQKSISADIKSAREKVEAESEKSKREDGGLEDGNDDSERKELERSMVGVAGYIDFDD
ncbi:unnamed protein product [Cyclocybe aegerita]|uniref:Uncharacterized protein n=1 Tax=Cyclocybe aegerita TaxID=1973307 RepID=A0A8S0WYV7_CYCAE|nr:unnamed protein product [Cyclocybe aegerita]